MSAFLHKTHTCNRDEGLQTPRFLACTQNFSLFSEQLDGGQATGTDNIRETKLVRDSRSRQKTCNNNQSAQKRNGMVTDHLENTLSLFVDPSDLILGLDPNVSPPKSGADAYLRRLPFLQSYLACK